MEKLPWCEGAEAQGRAAGSGGPSRPLPAQPLPCVPRSLHTANPEQKAGAGRGLCPGQEVPSPMSMQRCLAVCCLECQYFQCLSWSSRVLSSANTTMMTLCQGARARGHQPTPRSTDTWREQPREHSCPGGPPGHQALGFSCAKLAGREQHCQRSRAAPPARAEVASPAHAAGTTAEHPARAGGLRWEGS